MIKRYFGEVISTFAGWPGFLGELAAREHEASHGAGRDMCRAMREATAAIAVVAASLEPGFTAWTKS